MPLEVEIVTKGKVSNLFADDEGAISASELEFIQISRRQRRQRLLLAEDEEDLVEFDLSDYLEFELRRGDEFAASPEEL